MSRVQLALNVSNIDEAVDFYSQLFDTTPAKRKPGYANFAIDTPPLKLVLIENTDTDKAGTLNHLGVEVESPEEVGAAQTRLATKGMETVVEDNVTCCYAVQDKVWVHDPDNAPWEIYTVLENADEMKSTGKKIINVDGGDVCCGTGSSAESSCC
jgi:catechol 2,3-dioxygenase-like lactoylglutathione lyase family enzyme